MYCFLSGKKSLSILLNFLALCICSSSEIFWERGRKYCFSRYTLYISHWLNTTASSCPPFWKGKRTHLPSARVWETLDAGALSAAHTFGEPGNWGTGEREQGVGLCSPSAEHQVRRGNRCADGRRGLLETQRLTRIRGNSRVKTDQQTPSNVW